MPQQQKCAIGKSFSSHAITRPSASSHTATLLATTLIINVLASRSFASHGDNAFLVTTVLSLAGQVNLRHSITTIRNSLCKDMADKFEGFRSVMSFGLSMFYECCWLRILSCSSPSVNVGFLNAIASIFANQFVYRSRNHRRGSYRHSTRVNQACINLCLVTKDLICDT